MNLTDIAAMIHNRCLITSVDAEKLAMDILTYVHANWDPPVGNECKNCQQYAPFHVIYVDDDGKCAKCGRPVAHIERVAPHKFLGYETADWLNLLYALKTKYGKEKLNDLTLCVNQEEMK